MSTQETDAFAAKVRHALECYGMVPERGGRVLVACSGGADSVCLAHVLSKLEVPIALAHFDHGLRGDEGAVDGDLVEALAEFLGVPCHRGRASGEINDERGSVEMAAREMRYGFLCDLAREEAYAAIATAHHLDDQAETVIMRILRGTSPRGLSGIPAVGQHDGIPVVRPLIDCTRGEIRQWLEPRDATFREDPTNKDISIIRNRVRHTLLPMLEREFNPNVREAVLRLSALVADDDALLTAAAADFARTVLDSEGAILRRRFAPAPPPLQRRVLAAWFERHGVAAGFDTIEVARAHIIAVGTGKRLSLSADATLENTRIRSRIVDPNTEAAPTPEAIPLRVPGTTEGLGYTFIAEYCEPPEPPYGRHCSPSVQYFDGDWMGHALAVRAWVEGDRIEPLGMDGTKKLQDWFTDEGIPRSDRGAMPLLLAGDQIAWIPGGPVAAPFVITEATVRALRIEVR